MFLKVAEFHTAFDLSHPDKPTLLSCSERELRKRLLIEEVQELIAELRTGKRSTTAKELADVCYILAGTAVAYGIAPNRPFASPFTNCGQMEVFIHTPLDRIINAYLRDYLRAEDTDDLDAIWTSINFMLWAMFGFALQLDIPLNAVFAEVHRSNMSKILPDGSILRRADGKVLKPPTYCSPDIETILREHAHG